MTGGRLAGRRIAAPRGGAVRPTADRVRESTFARLQALEGARVLDLYAGSGALGIEALSRGAQQVVFVDRSAVSLASLRVNLAQLGLAAACRIVRADACRAIRRLAAGGERFDLILLDPPYGPGEADRALAELAAADILKPGGTLVLETSRRHPPRDVPGLERCDARSHGDTLIVRFEATKVGAGAERSGAQGGADPGTEALEKKGEGAGW